MGREYTEAQKRATYKWVTANKERRCQIQNKYDKKRALWKTVKFEYLNILLLN